MSKTKKSKSAEKDKDTVYRLEDLPQLWRETPLYLTIEDASILDHSPPVHDYISLLLGNGIPEDDGEQRYFLTANEILDKVNTNFEDSEKPMKLSMLYYHLEKLQEQNCVNYIHAQDGQYKRKYFSKSAKVIMLSNTEEDVRAAIDNNLKPILQLLDYYKVNIADDELQSIKDDMYKKREDFRLGRIEWLEKDENLVSNPNLDLVNAFNYLAVYMLNYSSTKKLFEILSSYIEFLKEC